MKILMTKSWNAPEYLDDGLLHGLRSIFGNDVVEYPRMWWMYSNEFGPNKKDLSKIAARGFTLYGRMNDSDIDRTDIEGKIRSGYFDLIIMHAWYPSQLANVIYEHTPTSKIVWLDGRDEQLILEPYVGFGRYFKRELATQRSDVFPIGFAVPEENIQTPLVKTRSLAPCIAGDVSTYVYNNEADYYQQYNESLFGITKKKDGWDCLRHYEILLSRCIPWFVDIEDCPEMTCTSLPKHDLLLISQKISQDECEEFMNGHLREWYDDMSEKVHTHFLANCTTKALAKYVIDTVRR